MDCRRKGARLPGPGCIGRDRIEVASKGQNWLLARPNFGDQPRPVGGEFDQFTLNAVLSQDLLEPLGQRGFVAVSGIKLDRLF